MTDKPATKPLRADPNCQFNEQGFELALGSGLLLICVDGCWGIFNAALVPPGVQVDGLAISDFQAGLLFARRGLPL